VVIQDYEEPEVKLDLFGGTSGTYACFDQFDRIVDHRWYDYGASADVDRYKYGYDRASNRIWKENVVAANNGKDFDEFYTYDGLHRLQNSDRGDLNIGKTAITGTPANEEDWTLDPLGNWSNFVQKTSGTTDLSQSRTVSEVNEITDITETTGPSWITPAFDRNGNMTTVPKPADPTVGFTCTYDAWNRMVKVEEGVSTAGEYAYDALKRRITKDVDSTVLHFLYSSQWQSLEERLDSSTDPDRQLIWGPQYVDQLLLRDRDTSDPANGTLDERFYALQDANWNVCVLTNVSGEATERYSFDAYGTPRLLSSSFEVPPSALPASCFLFGGYLFDDELRVYKVRNRDYHAALGGWSQRDPVQPGEGSRNLYLYATNAPIHRIDASGLQVVPLPPIDIPPPYFPPHPKPPRFPDPIDLPKIPSLTCDQFLNWLQQHLEKAIADDLNVGLAFNCGVHIFCGNCGKTTGLTFPSGRARICFDKNKKGSFEAWRALLVHEAVHAVQLRRAGACDCPESGPIIGGKPPKIPQLKKQPCDLCRTAEIPAYAAQAAYLYPGDLATQANFVAAGVCHSCEHVCGGPCPPFPEEPFPL
ncbi:MAG TPA: RHS repeat-associated core domain-containing protein, partial [Pirellulaceae bacterium]|nr:RHS repeat-associated core domain-containing protein [Pirellulaceae bacterium]